MVVCADFSWFPLLIFFATSERPFHQLSCFFLFFLLEKVMEDEFNAVPDDDSQTIELADRASLRKIADIERDDADEAVTDSSEDEAHV